MVVVPSVAMAGRAPLAPLSVPLAVTAPDSAQVMWSTPEPAEPSGAFGSAAESVTVTALAFQPAPLAAGLSCAARLPGADVSTTTVALRTLSAPAQWSPITGV